MGFFSSIVKAVTGAAKSIAGSKIGQLALGYVTGPV